MSQYIPAKLRSEVTERANGLCEYCLSDVDFSHSPFDIEHIIPIVEGGKTESENLALSCHGCNLHKSIKLSGYDVLSDEEVRLFNPRKDIWEKHFSWAKEFTIIIGLTPIGRATVETLKLNRRGLINQRKVLYYFNH